MDMSTKLSRVFYISSFFLKYEGKKTAQTSQHKETAMYQPRLIRLTEGH
jgi:hypothetical protein